MNITIPTEVAQQIAAALEAAASAPVEQVQVQGGRVEVPLDLLTEVIAARAAEAVVKAAKERSEARLKAYMGNATEGAYEGQVVVTYAPGERKALDQSALKEAMPEVVAQFTKATPVRPLLFKSKVVASLFGAA